VGGRLLIGQRSEREGEEEEKSNPQYWQSLSGLPIPNSVGKRKIKSWPR